MELSKPAKGASPTRISVVLVARTTPIPQHPCLGHGIVDGVRGQSSPSGRPRTFSPNTFVAYLSAQHFLGAAKVRAARTAITISESASSKNRGAHHGYGRPERGANNRSAT